MLSATGGESKRNEEKVKSSCSKIKICSPMHDASKARLCGQVQCKLMAAVATRRTGSGGGGVVTAVAAFLGSRTFPQPCARSSDGRHRCGGRLR